MMKSLLLVISALISVQISAENHFVVMGGGGEPLNNPGTQFDTSLENAADFYNANSKNYTTIINFNGGHIKTDKIIDKNFKGAVVRPGFSIENYKAVVNELIEKLKSDPPLIDKNQKILLFINSHGAESKKDQLTHNISASNSELLDMKTSGPNSIDLDSLAELSKLAEDRGVKLGIIDASCHSGNSLSLGNSKTCVITGSGPNHYAFTNFGDAIAAALKKGKNLEEAYLEARKKVSGEGFPMISSIAGQQTQQMLYPLLTPYMYFHGEYRGMAMDKIDKYLFNEDAGEMICKREKQFISLQKLLDLAEKMNAFETRGFFWNKKIEGEIDLAILRGKILSYKKTQDDYLKRIKELDLSTLDKKEDIFTDDYLQGANLTSHKDLLNTDYEKIIKIKKEALLDSSLTAAKKDELKKLLIFFERSQEIKTDVLIRYPQYVQRAKILEEIKNDERLTFKIANGIIKEAHKLYTAYYEASSRVNSEMANPCKDFVL
jgi:hypothetical protein